MLEVGRLSPAIGLLSDKGRCLPCRATPDTILIKSVDERLASVDAAQAGLQIRPERVYRNLSAAQLYEMALRYEPGTTIVDSGALATFSGAKTGRSPADKRVVRDAQVEKDIWWASDGNGSPNIEMDDSAFMGNRQRALNYLGSLDRVFVQDGFANWDSSARLKVRVIASRAYHALFMQNMLIRPTADELKSFGEPDFTIFNAGAADADPETPYVTSRTCVAISLTRREMVILGTQYAGEMKKGVFSVMHYMLPRCGVLSLHSGCNVGARGDATLFFGLSGTGKTTLSTDGERRLVGDDEHGWGDTGVFNIEGGCYAKCIELRSDHEPQIYSAIRFGAVLENVVVDETTRTVDFASSAVTENTRACYPIDFIANAKIPCVASHPKNVILLCCDAFGVLPPVSRLTCEQAMYHFVSGYTAKVAGTEVGVTEPTATFSACFGGAFLMWHPMKYAAMLADKMARHGATAWLINTGWIGGGYGVGRRIPLPYTRAIVSAIHNGAFDDVDYISTPVFNLQVPSSCPGVPDDIMVPEKQWSDKLRFKQTLTKLASLFTDNFSKFADGGGFVTAAVAGRIAAAGPRQPAAAN